MVFSLIRRKCSVESKKTVARLIFVILGLLVFAACDDVSSDTPVAETVAESDSAATASVPSRNAPVLLEEPEAPIRVQELNPERYDLLCLGAERPFPDLLGRNRISYEPDETVLAWIAHLTGATIVDSNTGIKAFDLYENANGIWVDNELRPSLYGHEFVWNIEYVGDDRWSDVGMTLTFEQNYKIHLPLRWRDRQIVNDVFSEGIVVTETRECGAFPSVSTEPLDLSKLWVPQHPPQYPDRFPTTPTTIKPRRLLSVGDEMWAEGGDLWWSWVNSDGKVLGDIKAVRGGTADYVSDGTNVWLTDPGEGQVRKISFDGELLGSFLLHSADRIAFDGEHLWITQSDRSSLNKVTAEGETLLTVDLSERANGGQRRSGPGASRYAGSDVFYAAGAVWVGVEHAWSVNAYNLDGSLRNSTYLHSRPGPMEFDGEHIWVSVPDNSQIWKFDIEGNHIQTIELAWSFSLNAMAFDGSAIWALDSCCERHINGSKALRIELDGTITGRFLFEYQTGDIEFDGERLWISHDEEKAFTILDPDVEPFFWTELVGPYTEQEFNVMDGDQLIAGTLTLPETPGPHPAVLVVQNANGGHRDNDWFGLRHGHEFVNNFARLGYAVYRYDMPGIGLSSGTMFDYTVLDIAGDVEVILNELQAHPEIDGDQVGLLALGEALLYALPVAAERDDIAWSFYYNLGGTTVLDNEFAPSILIARYSDQTEESIADIIRQFRLALDIASSGGDWTEFEELMRVTEIERSLKDENFENVVALPFISVRRLKSEYFASTIGMDLGDYIEQITETPFVGAFGGLNILIHPEYFEPSTLAAIERSGNPDARTVTFARMNDILQPAQSGRGEEFDLLPPVIYPSYIAPGFLEYMTNWILERTEFPGEDSD
jgi:hypothetical protein